jgi:hypothetical protein
MSAINRRSQWQQPWQQPSPWQQQQRQHHHRSIGQWVNIVGRGGGGGGGGHGGGGHGGGGHGGGGHGDHGGHDRGGYGGWGGYGDYGWGGWGWPYGYGYDGGPYYDDDAVLLSGQSLVGNEGGPGPILPRNALVQDPGPDRAGREVLPMSTGVAILPTQSAQITARPQRVAFRPERVFISAAGTSGGAADWVVNDIKIGNRSQFSQSGDVPGDMFATNAIDGFVSFETAQTAMDVVMVVTYIGLNESGVPFFASIVGTAAI